MQKIGIYGLNLIHHRAANGWNYLLKNIGPEQALAYQKKLNSEASLCEKLHATYQVGMSWHAMIIAFRTPLFSFLFSEMYGI